MNKFIISLTLIIFSHLSLAYAQKSGNIANNVDKVKENYINATQELLLNNNSEKAAILLAEALKIDSTHAPSHYYLTMVISAPADVIKHSELAVKYDSLNVWYKMRLVQVYADNQIYDKAEVIAKEILKNDLGNQNSYLNLIALQSGLEEYDAALQTIDSLESRFGESEQTIMSRLMIYGDQPVSKELSEKLIKIVDKNPQYLQPLLMVAENYMRSGQKEKGIEFMKRAEEVDSTNFQIIATLSDYYYSNRDYPNMFKYSLKVIQNSSLDIEAKINFVKQVLFNKFFYTDYFTKVSELISAFDSTYPDNIDAGHLVAQHYINAGLHDMAIERYQDMIDRGVCNEATYYNLLGLHSYMKNYIAVVDVCDALLKKYPENFVDIQMQKSFAYMQLEDYKKSISILKKSVKGAKDSIQQSSIYGMMGDVYQESGDKKLCYKSYDKALALDSANIVVLNNYAYYLSLENRDLDIAIEMIKKVLEVDPENGTYLDTYGWLLYQQGRYEEAAVQLKMAVEKDTTSSPDVLMHYGDALYKLGKKVNAKVFWSKAEKSGADPEEMRKRSLLK